MSNKKYLALAGGKECRPVNPYLKPIHDEKYPDVLNSPAWHNFEANNPTLAITEVMPEGEEFSGKPIKQAQYTDSSLGWFKITKDFKKYMHVRDAIVPIKPKEVVKEMSKNSSPQYKVGDEVRVVRKPSGVNPNVKVKGLHGEVIKVYPGKPDNWYKLSITPTSILYSDSDIEMIKPSPSQVDEFTIPQDDPQQSQSIEGIVGFEKLINDRIANIENDHYTVHQPDKMSRLSELKSILKILKKYNNGK